MKTIEPDPVKFFIGILFSDVKLLEKVIHLLTEKFGDIDYTSPDFKTGAYNEMFLQIRILYKAGRK